MERGTAAGRKKDAWDLDIEAVQQAGHPPPANYELRPPPDHLLDTHGFQRSVTMTIALDNREGAGGSGAGSRVALMVSGAAAGLVLLLAVLLLLVCRKRAMKRRSEKLYKLKQEEKDPWTEVPSGKSSGCLKLCTEGMRGPGLPTYYQRAEIHHQHQHQPEQHQHQHQHEGAMAPECSGRPRHHQGDMPRHYPKAPAAPPATVRGHIPPPLEPAGGGGGQRWTDNVVYISGYSPTLERRKPSGSEWGAPAGEVPPAPVHGADSAAYRTLPSKGKRLQQFYAAASSAEAACSAACDPGEVSPDRVDMMLLDEEMRTRSLPSWMRNKGKARLQDASQHPLSFSHKQRNRMGNDAASVIARARTQYPSRSGGQEPHIVYDVRTAL